VSCVIDLILLSSCFSHLTGLRKYDKFSNKSMVLVLVVCFHTDSNRCHLARLPKAMQNGVRNASIGEPKIIKFILCF
jgi:hypothetical protein